MRVPLTDEISRHIWRTKYRYRTPAGAGDATIEDTWRRMVRALAAVEPKDQELWAGRFYGILEGFRFLPAGRIQAGAGTPHQVTLFNCFVMGVIEDSIESIFENLKEGAITLQQGGGYGCARTARARRAPGEVATRLLDDVIDASRFPLPAQRREAQGARRLGLGTTGLGDAPDHARPEVRSRGGVGRRRRGHAHHSAYRASIALARDKGSFPYFDRDQYLGAPSWARCPRHPGRGRAAWHPQQPSECDRARRHHQPAGEQRFERPRAGLRPSATIARC